MARTPSQAVGEQVRQARKMHEWRQEDLAARLNQLGALGWRQSKIAKLERGEMKRLSIDELLELAAALGVPPMRLLFGDGDVAITGKIVVGPVEFRQWLGGKRVLRAEDRHTALMFTFLRPDEEWKAKIAGLQSEMGEPILGEEEQ